MELPALFRYQAYEKQKVINRKRTAIIAPPGSGKTRPAIEGVNELGGFEGPVLVLCTGPAVPQWIRQIPLWTQCPEYADYIHVVRGNKADRVDLWEQAAETGYGTYITNYSLFYRDYNMISRVPWKVVYADEYHKVMRNHKKAVKKPKPRLKTYGLFTKMTRHTPILVMLSGSLVRKHPASMFTAFQSVDPIVWSSYWRFVNTFCYVDDEGPFGRTVGGAKNVAALHSVMDEYLAYIPNEVVADQLPEGKRNRVTVRMTKEQRKIYDELDADMLAITGDDVLVAKTSMHKLMMLRQLLCCPKILDPSLGMGAGYEEIVDTLDEQPHVCIFVPFRPACDYIKEDLERKGYKNVHILRGGMDEVEIQQATDVIRQRKGILVGTIQFAESYDLETCDTSWFLGYDYTIDQNEQAEGRTRRAISEHKFVKWNYIAYERSCDDFILHQLGEDADNVNMILRRPEEYIRWLKGGGDGEVT